MSRRSDFKIGDRVWHASRRSVGTVEQNTGLGLSVRFEDWPEHLARFDDDWFRVCPTLLRHAKPEDRTDNHAPLKRPRGPNA